MHTIIAPLGSGMNHLRWLLLLSTEYDSMSIMPNNLTEKTIFIKLNVYRKDRNCFNWIRYESIHRYLLNNIIQVHHNLKLIPNKSSKFLVINAEPNDCLKNVCKTQSIIKWIDKRNIFTRNIRN